MARISLTTLFTSSHTLPPTSAAATQALSHSIGGERTFRQDHAAEPSMTYIAGRKPAFAAKAKVQTNLVVSGRARGI